MRLSIPILAFIVALVFVSPAMAEASWQPPGSLSTGKGPAEQPQVAVDARGDSVYVWRRWDGTVDRIQTRSRSAAGVLSPIQTLSPSGHSGARPQVAVDANGDAVFIWQRSDGTNLRIQTRTRSAAGTLGPTLTLSAAGQDAEYPQVAVDSSGNAVFAWERFDGAHERIQTRTLSAAGTRGSTLTLSAAGQDAADVHVAVDPSGNAVFAWKRFDGTVDRIQTRALSAAGTLSSTKTLSDPGKNAYEPRVAVDLGGDAVIMWQRWDGIENVIQVRSRSAAGAVSSTQNLATGTGTATPVRAQLAVDPQGNAVVVWENREGTAVCCMHVQARVRLADGTLGVTQDVSDPGVDAQEPHVAVDANANAFVVWHEATNAQTADARIYAAVGSY